MRILSIETSCDETAVSIVEASGGLESPVFAVLRNSLFSQVELHKEYGGVFPNLAKREHAKNLVPLLLQSLTQAKLLTSNNQLETSGEKWEEIQKILEKEYGLYELFKDALEKVTAPHIDAIAVTCGPGLEPALWVGISFAKALSTLWNIPVIGINHMEGHITSVLLNGSDGDKNDELEKTNNAGAVEFPALALLISGGHTELVEIKAWGQYSIIGQTRDDAVGEAFDKVARLLGLPYPGGPQISALAEISRNKTTEFTQKDAEKVTLPRPMLHSGNLDFSFSGLKTAVLYHIRDHVQMHGELTEADTIAIAKEFEDAVVEVLTTKTKSALEQTGAQTLIVAGGVTASKRIRESFVRLEKEIPGLSVRVPTKDLATDNAVMIAITAYIEITLHPELLQLDEWNIIAKGNLRF